MKKIHSNFIGFEYDQSNMRYRNARGTQSRNKFVTARRIHEGSKKHHVPNRLRPWPRTDDLFSQSSGSSSRASFKSNMATKKNGRQRNQLSEKKLAQQNRKSGEVKRRLHKSNVRQLNGYISSNLIDNAPKPVQDAVGNLIDSVVEEQRAKEKGYKKFRRVIFGNSTRKYDKKQLRQIFDEADVDKNGYLDYFEFGALCNKMNSGKNRDEIQAYFDENNVDKNAVIDFEEFSRAIMGTNIGHRKVRKKRSFQTSTPKKKSIHIERKRKIMIESKPEDHRNNIEQSYEHFRQCMFGKKAQNLSINKLRSMFDHADKDKNGALDFFEFSALCNKLSTGNNHNINADTKRYFEQKDVDRNGMIDFREFVRAISGKELTETEIKRAKEYSSYHDAERRQVRKRIANVRKPKNVNSDRPNGLFDSFAHFFGLKKDIKLTEEQLQSMFKKIDADNSQMIDFQEFKQCAKLLKKDGKQMKETFNLLDRDGDGFIDYAEFRCFAFGKETKMLSVNALRLMFDEADKNADGTLDFNEFSAVCYRMRFGLFANENIADIRSYFDKVDIDKNGSIDFDEFVEAVIGRKPNAKEAKGAIKYSNLSIDKTKRERKAPFIASELLTKSEQNVSDESSSERSEHDTTTSDESSSDEPSSAGLLGKMVSFFGGEKKVKPTEKKLRSVFDKADIDCADIIDFEEFKQCLYLFGLKYSDSECRRMFAKADKDESGYLDFEEFAQAMSSM